MIKVCGYCRVSTDLEDQVNSFENQKRYFRDYIQSQSGWELYEIYADEGISGTGTKKRVQFNRMLADAYEGKFRMIVTKEVSRFSRNILDTIRYTRELKALGIGVIFVNDRINTLDPEAEMLLSFLASLAQEESRRTSSRVVWGQTRQMEKGVVFGRRLLGYDVNNGALTVNESGAEIVRQIYHMYALEQFSATKIAKFLTAEGHKTTSGSAKWTPGAVIRILKNEKYAGDLVQKKTYTPDYLTHEKRINRGAVPMVTVRDHHEPIVSREVWNLTQDRLLRNNKNRAGKGGCSNRHAFSGKILCVECGRAFVCRYKYLKDGTRVRRWHCGSTAAGGAERCNVGIVIRDDDAINMLQTALRSLPGNFGPVIHNVTELVMNVLSQDLRDTGSERRKMLLEKSRLQQKIEAVLDSYFSGEITNTQMLTMKGKYEVQLAQLKERLKDIESEIDEDALRAEIYNEITEILSGTFKSEVFCKSVLDSLTVFKDRHLELRLKYLPQVFHFSG